MYAGSCAGVYYAFHLDSGEIRWSHDFRPTVGHATFHGDPLLAADILVTGTEALDPVRTVAFDPATGTVRWERTGPTALTRSDVVGVADLAIGRSQKGELVALERSSGDVRWTVPHQGRRYPPDVAESPAVVGTDVAFSAPDGAVYRVDGGTGVVRWRADLGCDVTTSVAARDDDLYAGCRDGGVVRLAAADGRLLGRIPLPPGLEGRIAVTAVRVIVPGGTRRVLALDRALTKTLWTYDPGPGRRLSVVQPLVWDPVVITGTSDGDIIALDLDDGAVRWTATVEGQIRGLGRAGETLLVGTIEGRLYAIDARSLPR